MRRISLFLLCILGASALAQSKSYPVPKYPPKFSMSTKNFGPKPGSKTTDRSPDNAVFKRVHSRPAGLRLLVRANCNTAIGQNQLILRAQKSTLDDGPTVQMDWERIRGESVTFWAVFSMEKETVTIDLKKTDGRYVSQGIKRNTTTNWQVDKIQIPSAGGTCVKEKEMANRDMRVAIINLLNSATLRHFRKPLSN